MELVAQVGIEKLTTRKLTANCKLSEPYLYQCYDSIPDLLESIFLDIDKELSRIVSHALASISSEESASKCFKEQCWDIWSVFWDYLLANRIRTIFYWRFYQSGFYTPSVSAKRMHLYRLLLEYMDILAKEYRIPEGVDLMLMLTTIVDGTLLSAHKELRCQDDGQKNKKAIFETYCTRLIAIVKKAQSSPTQQ